MKCLVWILYFTAVYFTKMNAQRTFLDNLVYPGRIIRKLIDRTTDQLVRTRSYRRALQTLHKTQEVINDSVPFPCPLDAPRSKEKPKSVHMLRPGDIDVVGGLGDSLAAGLGALSTNLFDLVREYRGVSFIIGGDKTWREYITLPNMLKEYNPNLIGYSIGATSTLDRRSQFNVAESGTMTTDTVYMTKVLLKRITTDKRVNITTDWKMITIFIGSNDFCGCCFEHDPEIVLQQHKESLITNLRQLRDNLPRTFVNVVSPPYVTILRDLTGPPQCYLTQRYGCPCVVGETFKSFPPKLNEIIGKWHKLEQEIVNYPEFDREDFTVVRQPLFEEPFFPRSSDGKIDISYLAEDCFHFSQRGHALVGKILWNNIVSPIGQKQKTLVPDDLKCLNSDHPYLFTRRNSNI